MIKDQKYFPEKTSLKSIIDSNIQDSVEETNFDQLKSLATRLQRIEKTAAECMEMFYEPHLRTFSVFPGLSDVRFDA